MYLVEWRSGRVVVQAQNINNTTCSAAVATLLKILLFWEEQRWIFSTRELQWMFFSSIASCYCSTQTVCHQTISPSRTAGCRLGKGGKKGRSVSSRLCYCDLMKLFTRLYCWVLVLLIICGSFVWFSLSWPLSSGPISENQVHFLCILSYIVIEIDQGIGIPCWTVVEKENETRLHHYLIFNEAIAAIMRLDLLLLYFCTHTRCPSAFLLLLPLCQSICSSRFKLMYHQVIELCVDIKGFRYLIAQT